MYGVKKKNEQNTQTKFNPENVLKSNIDARTLNINNIEKVTEKNT